MADYRPVSDALKEGADPAMLCMTCPWDRFCITPPAMTSDEVRAKIDQSVADDEAKRAQNIAQGKEAGMPMGSLLSTIMLAGKDTQSQVCPVFALRLRSQAGGEIVQQIRSLMKAGE